MSSPPHDERIRLYLECRLGDQLDWYERRSAEFKRAGGQLSVLAGTLLMLAAFVGALAGSELGPRGLWASLTVVVPALATAVAAIEGLYAFERHAKIYGDAATALKRLGRSTPDASDESLEAFVDQVEAILRKEQGQWGQLTSEADPSGG